MSSLDLSLLSNGDIVLDKLGNQYLWFGYDYSDDSYGFYRLSNLDGYASDAIIWIKNDGSLIVNYYVLNKIKADIALLQRKVKAYKNKK